MTLDPPLCNASAQIRQGGVEEEKENKNSVELKS